MKRSLSPLQGMGSLGSKRAPPPTMSTTEAPPVPRVMGTVTVLNLAGDVVLSHPCTPGLSVAELRSKLPDPFMWELIWEGHPALRDEETAGQLGWSDAVTLSAVARSADYDAAIHALRGSEWSKAPPLEQNEVKRLCTRAQEILLAEPSLLTLEPPVVVSAHPTGHMKTLNYIFDTFGEPGGTVHLFLGNYVNRGKHSLEVFILLLSYKLKYPEQLHLLRGRYDCGNLGRIYGFYDQCKPRYGVKFWKTFVEVFNSLPIAAVVGSRIYCVSGGLSPSMRSLEDLRQLQRPTEVPDQGLLCDVLWSDPDALPGWQEIPKGVSYTYGPDIVEQFLRENELDFMVVGNQVVEDGYEVSGPRCTLFSVPDYCGEFNNRGAVLLLDENLERHFTVFAMADVERSR